MALTDNDISALYFEVLSQHLREQDRKTEARFACAVEAEVQKQDEALIRLMLAALECSGEPGRDGYVLPISFARAVLAKWGAPAPEQDDSLTAAYMAGAHDVNSRRVTELEARLGRWGGWR